MTLYSDMNNKIVDLLRMGDTPVELYAAQRIEELELINMELIDRVLEIVNENSILSDDLKKQLSMRIKALRGEQE